MIVEPFKDRADFEVIHDGDDVKAVMIFNPLPIPQLDYLRNHYARPHQLDNKILTARQWKLWGCLTTKGWALSHLNRPRPRGERMQFMEVP